MFGWAWIEWGGGGHARGVLATAAAGHVDRCPPPYGNSRRLLARLTPGAAPALAQSTMMTTMATRIMIMLLMMVKRCACTCAAAASANCAVGRVRPLLSQ